MSIPANLIEGQSERPYYEWSRGILRAKVSPKSDHSRVQFMLGALLVAWGKETGVVGGEIDTNVTPSPGDTRRYLPDMGYTSFASLAAAGQLDSQIPEIPPDLAIEVLSPYHDRVYLADKVAAYLAAGSSVVIVADPASRSFMVHRAAGVEKLATGDVFRDPAFEGLTLDVAQVFGILDRRG
jgi:Uma2 family endonuclease